MDQKTIDILNEWKKRQKHDYFKLGYNTLKPDQLVFSNKYNEYLQLAIPQKWMLSVQKERLGHSNINTTLNIFTHVTKKAKGEAIQKFANYINI